jgi:hypothetical protein
MKSSRAISRVRCVYWTDVSRTISVIIIGDRDGPRNVGSVQTPDTADSPRRFHRISLPRMHKNVSTFYSPRKRTVECPAALHIASSVSEFCVLMKYIRYFNSGYGMWERPAARVKLVSFLRMSETILAMSSLVNVPPVPILLYVSTMLNVSAQ